MNRLYQNAATVPNVSAEFVFDDAVLMSALLRIYEQRFNPLTQLDRELFNEFWRIINEAAEKGLNAPGIDPDDDFIAELRRNNGVFTAFKVHRMQGDMAAQLLNENGNLKPFQQWMNDIQSIADHQRRQWLQTEYDTAVKRAHLAAQWRQFEREADVLPNLEWVKTLSLTPGEDHKPFWFPTPVVRPIGDPFWDIHRPGDRWGCKCGLRATDKKLTQADNLTKVVNDNPDAGLNNNPAKDGILFSDTHPYNPPSCAACTLAGKRVLNGKAKDCYNCSRPVELIKTTEL